ncbi:MULTISPECIES: ABC transporter permease [Heyndrickxia]|uniref:ABC transporter permease n=1 Tax=Heyndrickxia TaxID=2837504 RepID=UPI000CE29B47|nr:MULTISPECIES: ABC transporter permease [Heyndrickxia]AVD57484.1 ABC transporter permease [Heyndrickxia coagulans]MEC2224134.1 ABC transporter permease [Weizmannia sp. CD-2023]
MSSILHILKKEVITVFRNKRTLIFMLAFPLVLMLVLGSALSNAFDKTVSVGEIHVLYKNDLNKDAAPYFHTFQQYAEKSDIHFEKAGKNTDGLKEVKLGNADGYAVLNGHGIRLYTNGRNSIKGSILEGVFSAFADQYNLAAEVMKTAPEKGGAAFEKIKHNYIQTESLLPNKEPGAMDYYAIVITTMICLYASLGSSAFMQVERTRKTADRLIAAPVRKSSIFIGKLFADVLVYTACIALIIIVSKVVYKANWGNHLPLVFLVLLTEIILSVSIGIGVSIFSKSAATGAILNLFIQLSAFFGGAYFKIENPGKLQAVMDLSPLTWINQAITKIIYNNVLSAATPVAAANLGIALLILFISVTALQKREGL